MQKIFLLSFILCFKAFATVDDGQILKAIGFTPNDEFVIEVSNGDNNKRCYLWKNEDVIKKSPWDKAADCKSVFKKKITPVKKEKECVKISAKDLKQEYLIAKMRSFSHPSNGRIVTVVYEHEVVGRMFDSFRHVVIAGQQKTEKIDCELLRASLNQQEIKRRFKAQEGLTRQDWTEQMEDWQRQASEKDRWYQIKSLN